MKALLMHRDRDFDVPQQLLRDERALRGIDVVQNLLPNVNALTQDLELTTLFRAMANGDQFLFDVARTALFSGRRNDVDTILYRQAVLKDCMENPAVVRALYDLAVEAIEEKRKLWLGIYGHNPGAILHGAINLLELYMGILLRLRHIADEQAAQFKSDGFRGLFTMLRKELDDEYLASIQAHLVQLKPDGVLMSAELGRGNEGQNYVLRKPWTRSWAQRIFGKRPPAFSFRLHPRDEAGARALGELREQGIHLVANALAQSADHILSFFQMLRVELAFYVGCLNLYDRLAAKGEPVCFPQPVPAGERVLRYGALYDVCLSLHLEPRVVANTADADGKSLLVITGANRGGKTSFLRAIGLAQLMMQCGIFVGAESFAAELCTGLFTHYKREEDPTMKSGKFDEELARMSDIADQVSPNSILLFNESFAATNEREGSEIARQVVSALLEEGIKVFFVTFLSEFTRGFFERSPDDAIFLRAERLDDGTRTFKLLEAEPLETSYGEDLYRKIFSVGTESVSAG
jgi:hypothetical protein